MDKKMGQAVVIEGSTGSGKTKYLRMLQNSVRKTSPEAIVRYVDARAWAFNLKMRLKDPCSYLLIDNFELLPKDEQRSFVDIIEKHLGKGATVMVAMRERPPALSMAIDGLLWIQAKFMNAEDLVLQGEANEKQPA